MDSYSCLRDLNTTQPAFRKIKRQFGELHFGVLQLQVLTRELNVRPKRPVDTRSLSERW